MGKTLRIRSKPMKGWSSMVMRAATRNFPWKDIACELIDNSLANVRTGQPCHCRVGWDSKIGEFFIIDSGRGSNDIEAFFRPGKSGGNHGVHGNSTFGTGLFAIECYLDGHLQVVTDSAGKVYIAYRTIADDGDAEGEEHPSRGLRRSTYGLPPGGGTVVRFRSFRKRVPSNAELERIISHLGFAYSTAIEKGDLILSVELNGHRRKVKAAGRPKLRKLYESQLEHEGHKFDVEWGVTEETVADTGCRLIYGGKTFDVTARPCGKGRLSRFYAAIRIPRTAGLQSMDLLKKTAEMEFLEPLFQRCHRLFQPQLTEADRLCGDDLNRLISDTISSLLSRQRPAPAPHDPRKKHVEPAKQAARQEPETEEDDSRRFRRPPDKILVDWLGFGRPMPLAKYDYKSKRLSYNEDNETLVRLRTESKIYELACVAAGYIAYEIDKLDPQMRFDFDSSLYDEVYRKLIERASLHVVMPTEEEPRGNT
jgi:hypothetical protein